MYKTKVPNIQHYLQISGRYNDLRFDKKMFSDFFTIKSNTEGSELIEKIKATIMYKARIMTDWQSKLKPNQLFSIRFFELKFKSEL